MKIQHIKDNNNEICVYDEDGHEYIFDTIEEYISWLRRGTGSEERTRPLLSDKEYDAFREMFMNNEIGWMVECDNVHQCVHEEGEELRKAFVKIFGKDDLMTRWITLWAEAPYLHDWRKDDGDFPAFCSGDSLKEMVEAGERPEERKRIRSLSEKEYLVGTHEHTISWREVSGKNEEEAIANARKGIGNSSHDEFVKRLDIAEFVEEMK